MKKALKLASWVALAGILVPPILYFNGSVTHDGLEKVMLVATILWFVTTPFWMNDRSET